MQTEHENRHSRNWRAKRYETRSIEVETTQKFLKSTYKLILNGFENKFIIWELC